MIRNYVKIAWRNLIRNKTFSLINILGLSFGMACSLMIWLWVKDERAYDAFHVNKDRLYKVIIHNKAKDGSIDGSMDATPGLLADALRKEVPEVSKASTVVWANPHLFAVNGKTSREINRFGNEDFFEMFSFPFVYGNSKTALSRNENIVITQQLSEKYFGKENPVGKTVRIDNKKDYVVSGVIKNIPFNSTIRFDFLLPIKNCFDEQDWMVSGWGHYGPETYLLLRPDADAAKVRSRLKNFLLDHDKTITEKTLDLQLVKNMYLYGKFTNGVADGGRIEYVRIFSLVALFILLIACVNFMNLTTARSIKRAREVGVRKAVGALRRSLLGQFMSEAMITVFIAFIISLLLVILLLPAFNTLTGKQLSLPLNDLSLLSSLAGLLILTGLIAGSYPAFFLSSLKPVAVLKGTLKFKPGAALFRKGLVVFQFTISIVLIVCTSVIYRQVHYIETANLGVDRENIVYVPLIGDLGNKYELFRRDILKSGSVQSIVRSTTIPTNLNWATEDISWNEKDPENKYSFWEMRVGYDYIDAMKMQVIAGRAFSQQYGNDSMNILVNEAAAKAMKLDNPVGQAITYHGKQGQIIGVIKDFHLRSLHETISPLLIGFDTGNEFMIASMKIQPGKTKAAIATLEKASRTYNPVYPPDYLFADDFFKEQYKSELTVEKLANVFAFLAIFISCLGLFGLAMFMAEQRTREIGVRKVLGASVASIIGLFSKDFIWLIILSAALAFPVGWWIMNDWMHDFAYRVDISWWIFGLAGLVALAVALLTVSTQAVRAAVANPVKSLRTE
jgi:ABC-type antimicrobial peptide transport system permease subunit